MSEYTGTIKPIQEYDLSNCPDVLLWDKNDNHWVIGYFSHSCGLFNCITYLIEESPDWFAELPPFPPTPISE